MPSVAERPKAAPAVVNKTSPANNVSSAKQKIAKPASTASTVKEPIPVTGRSTAYEQKERMDWLTANGLPLVNAVGSVFLLPVRIWDALTDRLTGASARTVPGLPWVGSLLNVALNPLKFVAESNTQYGQPFWFGFNGRKMLSISDPESIHRLLLGEESLVQMWWEPRTFLKLMGPHSVFTLHGDEHMRMRQILFRSFTDEAIARMHSDFQSELRGILALLASRTEGSYPSTELGGLMFRHIMRFIGGADATSLKGLFALEDDYHEWAEGLGAIVPYPLPFTALRKGLAARDRIVAGVQEVIRGRTTVRVKDHKYDDALGDWLSSGAPEGLDGEEIPDQVLAFQFGGRLAMTNTMCSILHILANVASNADIARLRDELAQVGPNPTWTQLTKLPLLDAWFKECFRLCQATALLFREFMVDTSVAGASPGATGAAKQCPVAKGDLAMLSLGLSFHDPKVFGAPGTELDAGKFVPRRWANASEATKTYATMFGLGKRSCIGYLLATMTIKTFIAEVVTKYDVRQRGATRIFGFPAYINEPWAVLRRR